MTARKKGEDKYFVLYLCSTLIVLPSFLNLYIFFSEDYRMERYVFKWLKKVNF